MGLDDKIKMEHAGTSLEVQWLILFVPNAEGLGPIPGQGTRSHMAATKSSHAATKIFYMWQLKNLHVTSKVEDLACCN